MKTPWLHVVLSLFALLPHLALAANQTPPVPFAGSLHAWYRADTGLHSTGPSVSLWEDSSSSPSQKNLSRIVGSPRIWKVQTPEGPKSVVRLNGSSALWQPVQEWGRLAAPRTLVLLARVSAGTQGVLVDGSTRSGSDPILIGDTNPRWQIFRWDRTHGTLGGLILGADVSTQRGVACDIAEVLVFPRLLGDAEYAQVEAYLAAKWGSPTDLPDGEQIPWVSAFPGLTTQLLRKNQTDGVHTYRIPGLATSTRGTLLAVFDQRHKNGGDLPGDIDVGFLRSTDHGESWESMRAILNFDSAVEGSRGNGVGDPCIFVDRQTSRIFVAGLWSKGNRAWHGSGPGLTAEETGQLVITYSDDDGVTWSPPESITAQVKDPSWRLCFQGPGSGIQMRDGTLVMPAQFRESNGSPRSCFLFSADHGKTWQISPAAIPSERPTSESQIAELEDGSLLFTMRDESHSGQRAWCRFDWKTRSWGKPWLNLPDPTCQASLLELTDHSLLFCNPAQEKTRTSLTVRTSHDGGTTWSRGRVIDPGPSMYSCMTPMNDGRIGLLYEGREGLYFARFYPEGSNLAAHSEGRFEHTGKFGWWPERHRQKLLETKQNQPTLIFVGDSITQNWEEAGSKVWNRYYTPRHAANYGFRGDSTQHVIWRIENGEFDGLNPRLIVLLIGTNNARHGDFTPDQIVQGIQTVVTRLQQKCPASRILLLSIFPRDADPGGAMRLKCEEVNTRLPGLADGSRVVHLNINPAFLSPEGTLPADVSPDHLHLSAKGYQIWAEAMEPTLEAILRKPSPNP